MHIAVIDRASTTAEFGVEVQRNAPWTNQIEPPFGSMWVFIAPGETTEPDSHPEQEVFVVHAGGGRVVVDGQATELKPGDMVYVPPTAEHIIENLTASELVVLSLYWMPGERTRAGASES